MQLIRKKANGVVYYKFSEFDDVVLDTILIANGMRVLDMNNVDYEHLTGCEDTSFFVSGAMVYSDDDWLIVDQEKYDYAYSEALDKAKEDKYAEMKADMVRHQIDALGEPDAYRYVQAVQKYASTDGSSDPYDIDFRIGSDKVLIYQENNAAMLDVAKNEIDQLDTIEAVEAYPIPDFTYNSTSEGLTYLEYLHKGYI